MIAVDLFCGAGGLTRGLLNAEIEVVLGIDLNEECRRTFEENNKPAEFLRKDLREVTAAEIRRYFPPRAKAAASPGRLCPVPALQFLPSRFRGVSGEQAVARIRSAGASLEARLDPY